MKRRRKRTLGNLEKTYQVDALPLVSICCMAYNHAPYIRAAIDSFLSQKTSFGFEVLVHDDASTDGTVELLKAYEQNYPDLVHVFYEEENQYGKGKYQGGYIQGLLIPNARGRYIALCECDDCWRDDYKLQKQIEYLEAHPEVMQVCHSAEVVDGVTGEIIGEMGMGDEEKDLTPQEIIRYWNVPTASRVYRKELYKQYDESWVFDKPVGDFPSVLYGSLQGAIHYMPEAMSVYRFRTPGSWTSKMTNEDNLLRNNYRWINMYDSIDAATGRMFHDDLIFAAKGYVKGILGVKRLKDAGLSSFGMEAFSTFTLVDIVRPFIKRVMRKCGFRVVSTGFGANMKRKIERL